MVPLSVYGRSNLAGRFLALDGHLCVLHYTTRFFFIEDLNYQYIEEFHKTPKNSGEEFYAMHICRIQED